jgi:hypothetical protein
LIYCVVADARGFLAKLKMLSMAEVIFTNNSNVNLFNPITLPSLLALGLSDCKISDTPRNAFSQRVALSWSSFEPLCARLKIIAVTDHAT